MVSSTGVAMHCPWNYRSSDGNTQVLVNGFSGQLCIAIAAPMALMARGKGCLHSALQGLPCCLPGASRMQPWPLGYRCSYKCLGSSVLGCHRPVLTKPAANGATSGLAPLEGTLATLG